MSIKRNPAFLILNVIFCQITEVDKDGSPSKNPKPVKSGIPDHLFKYEVEEVTLKLVFNILLGGRMFDYSPLFPSVL